MIDPANRPERVDVGERDNADQEVPVTPQLIAFVLDSSGSMASLVDATISGYNEYLQGVRGNSIARFIKTTLGGTVRLGRVQPISEAEPLTRQNYRPDGGTPLYEAIGRTIELIDALPVSEPPVPVQFIILTDGEENQSAREWTRERVRTLIDERTNTGVWTFVYVGANQDAWAASRDIGVAGGNTILYAATPSSTGATFDGLRRMSTSRMSQSAGGQSMSNSTFADAGIDNKVILDVPSADQKDKQDKDKTPATP